MAGYLWTPGVVRHLGKGIHWIMPHVAVAVLFIGMLSGVTIPAMYLPGDRQVGYALMVCSLAVSLAAATWVRQYGAWRPSATMFGFLLCVITVSGVPGIFVHPSEAASSGLLFAVLLAVRNYLCFTALPRASVVYRSRMANAVVGWVLLSSVLVMLGSLHAASVSGISLHSSTRLTGEGHYWLNANTAGVYTALGILCAVMARFLPWVLRMFVILLGSYVLLLTQSRTALLALIVALAVYVAIRRRYGKVQLLALGLLGCLGGMYVSNPLVDSIRRGGQVGAMIRRTETARGDRWSGRVAMVRVATSRLRESPVVGFGFMSEGSRIDNGYLSYAVETGILGLSVYAALLALVLSRAVKLLRTSMPRNLQTLGCYTVCLTAFLLAHAVGEKTHPFQIAFTGSNAWALLAGLVFLHTSHSRQWVRPS